MLLLNKVQDKQIMELANQQNEFDYQLVQFNYLNNANNIIELVLMPVSDVMRHVSGQYCNLMVIENEYRSYSIVNMPENTGKIIVHIRIPKNPQFFLKRSDIGRTIKIQGPFGNCGYNFDLKIPTLFLAEGIGIAAFYSILEHKKFNLENYLLIWLKNFYDTEYEISRTEFWNKITESNMFVFLRDNQNDYESVLEKCTGFILNNKKVRLYIAGSASFNNAINTVVETFSSESSVEVFSDI